MVEMARLDPYRAKRRFDRTPEPTGGTASGDTIFVVQKHRASHFHYDFRLQVGDTLRSWAVPEGPCLDPKVRRFAKQVEDHPLDYARFEGRIPDGQYGAGEVIVWDTGTWVTLSDAETAIERGELKFRLSGKKLSGGWMLKRLPDDPTNWLLIKERDVSVRPLAEYDVLEEKPNSVLSDRAVEELAPKKIQPRGLAPPKPAKIDGAKAAPLPVKFRPQLAGEATQPPADGGWLHEIKFDGYRTIAFVDKGEVRLITRNGLDWTKRYAPLDKAFKALACKTAIIDGEIAVQDARGITVLSELEAALGRDATHGLTFFAFDLMYLDGYDLTGAYLEERKEALAALLDSVRNERSALQLSEHTTGSGSAFFERACELGLEGIISKRADARYVQARASSWVKVKRVDFSEALVVGFTTNAPRAVAALLLAEDVNGELRYTGKVGSGISDVRARELYQTLSLRARPKAAVPAPRMKDVTWVDPNWTARVSHRGRTEGGALRQPALIGVSPRSKTTAKRAFEKPRIVTDRDLAGVRVTSADREMFEDSGVTKLDVALHFARVADWMLPELMRRPLTLIRCPTGEASDIFYQRHAFTGLPEGVERIELSDEEGRGAFLTVTAPKGFLALPQFGTVEMHLWGCRIDDPEHPDRMVIDLDPDEALGWGEVCSAAERIRARLAGAGFESFLRTTGGKGLHLVSALAPGHSWKDLKEFSQALARLMAKEQPQLFTAVSNMARRKGRIYIDYLRNARGATAIASYSLRARPNFPVAVPIDWSEARGLGSGAAFTIKNIGQRLESIRHDPWEALGSNPAKITRGLRRDMGMGA